MRTDSFVFLSFETVGEDVVGDVADIAGAPQQKQIAVLQYIR